jgi:hypothetical protein
MKIRSSLFFFQSIRKSRQNPTRQKTEQESNPDSIDSYLCKKENIPTTGFNLRDNVRPQGFFLRGDSLGKKTPLALSATGQ